MSIHRFSIRILPLLGVMSLLSCGEMNTMISTTGSYKVAALVSKLGLEECSILGPDDALTPVLSTDATYDPDAVILQVSLRDQLGIDAAVPVVYRERRSTASKVLGNDLEGVILVDRLTDTLPAFSFPANLSSGMYNLVFEVRGEDGVLFEKTQSVFFTGDSPFILKGLTSYPPGTGPSSTTLLFPQSVYLLMVAEFETGEDVDPYFIWSFGGKRISEGFASEGLDKLLWRTPSTDGFHRLQVEMLPERPSYGSDTGFRGYSSELVVATSSSAPLPGLPGANSTYLSIFRFLGNLDHAGSKDTANWDLTIPEDLKPEWSRFDSGYGLALDPQQAYKSEGTLFPVIDGAITPHALSLLVAPGVPGRILSAVFDATPVIETDPRMLPDSNGHFPVLDNSVGMVETDPSNGTAPPPDPALLAESPKAPAKKRPVGGLSFSLDVTVDTLVLNMVSGGAILTLSVSPGQEWNGEAHTVRIECIPDPEGMRVSMTLDGIVRDTDSVSLPASLSGSGYFELGGSTPATQVDSTTVIETDPAIEPESSDLALPGSPTQTAGRNVIDDVALEWIVVKPVPVVTPLSEEKSESL